MREILATLLHFQEHPDSLLETNKIYDETSQKLRFVGGVESKF